MSIDFLVSRRPLHVIDLKENCELCGVDQNKFIPCDCCHHSICKDCYHKLKKGVCPYCRKEYDQSKRDYELDDFYNEDNCSAFILDKFYKKQFSFMYHYVNQIISTFGLNSAIINPDLFGISTYDLLFISNSSTIFVRKVLYDEIDLFKKEIARRFGRGKSLEFARRLKGEADDIYYPTREVKSFVEFCFNLNLPFYIPAIKYVYVPRSILNTYYIKLAIGLN